MAGRHLRARTRLLAAGLVLGLVPIGVIAGVGRHTAAADDQQALVTEPRGMSCDNATAATLAACVSRLLSDPDSPYARTHRRTAAEKAPLTGPRLAAAAEPSAVGAWQTVSNLVTSTGEKVNAVHVSLLTTGTVLITAGSGNNPDRFAAKVFQAWVWSPVSKTLAQIPDLPDDLFCAGHMHLADGTPVFFGGTEQYNVNGQYFKGTKRVYTFDVATNRFRLMPDMAVGRWYPTATANAAGNPVIVSGIDEIGYLTDLNETYSPSTGRTTALPGRRLFPMYAGVHLLASGSMFYSGANVFGRVGATPGIWTWPTNAFKPIPELPAPDCRDQAASVMLYPAQTQRVMVIGGGCSTGVTGRTAVATLTGSTPKMVEGPWLGWASMQTCAVNLPDRSVFVSGGSDHNLNPRLRASVLKYGATAWTEVASPTVGRAYHNSCLLMPDGSVTVFGSDVDGQIEPRVEVYKPWYMHVTRPAITSVTTSMRLGSTYVASYTGPSKIVDAHLTRLGSPTHSSDPNLRQVQVYVVPQSTAGRIGLRLDTRWGVLPLGSYLLTLVDARGVPSASKIIRVLPAASGGSAPASALPAACGHCCGATC